MGVENIVGEQKVGLLILKKWIRTLFQEGGGGGQKESSPFSLPIPPTKFPAVGKMAAMGQNGAKEKNKMAPKRKTKWRQTK